MSDKPYIAEFHDLAKLIDTRTLSVLGLKIEGQRLDEIDSETLSLSMPTSPSWYAPYCEDLKSLDSKVANECGKWAADVFLTRIADRLASSFRLVEFERGTEKKGRAPAGLRKIWKDVDEPKGRADSLISSKEAFSALMEFWDHCRNHEELFDHFKHQLDAIPEDKAPPYNVTSLYSHLRLVGMMYRVLRRSVESTPTGLSLAGKDVSQVAQAMGGRVDQGDRGAWSASLSLVNVGVRPHLSRLRDLNVFVLREQLMQQIESTFPDHVLFRTPESLLLFTVAGGDAELRELVSPLLEQGFPLDVQELEAELGLLVSDFERQWSKFHASKAAGGRLLSLLRRHYSEPTPQLFTGRICEICQMAPALPDPWVKNQVQDWLCERCMAVREMHEPATEISDWPGATLWVKVSLSRPHLALQLASLFERYVQETFPGIKSEEAQKYVDAFRPLAVETDFVRDYRTFVQEFQTQLIGELEGLPKNTAIPWSYALRGYPELTVLPIVSNREFLMACEIFVSMMESRFPRSCGDSPITLALSLSPGKYPYQEHWRFLTQSPDPRRPISIQRAFDFGISLSFAQFRALRRFHESATGATSAFLHRLAAIERELGSPTALLFEAFKSQRMRPALRPLLFHHGISIETVLGFYKLTVWQGVPSVD